MECKHSLSQHWADKPFPSIVSKHVNEEFRTLKQESCAKVAALKQGQHQKPPTLPKLTCGATNQSSDKVVVQLKEKQIRKKPAYMFFRDDFISLKARCSPDSRINPISKEFWAEMKTQWLGLSPPIREYYEGLAEKSAVEAEATRQKRKMNTRDDQQDASTLKVRQPTALGLLPHESERGACHGQVAYFNPWCMKAADLDACSDFGGMWSGILQAVETIGEDTNLLGNDVADASPISEDMLQKAWQTNLAKGVTWSQSLEQFDRETQRFAAPTLGQEFPKKVTYQGHCGGFCRRNNPMELVGSFVKLTDAFVAAVKALGPISSVSKKYILLQVDVDFPNTECQQIFAWLVAPSAASGVYPAEQVFVLCDHAGDISATSFYLDLTLVRADDPNKLRSSCALILVLSFPSHPSCLQLLK